MSTRKRGSDRAGRPAMSRRDVRGLVGGSIVSGSGWRSPAACRARMLRRKPACRPRWAPGGFARVADAVSHPRPTVGALSAEAIYQSLHVQGRGKLRRELTACLRSGRAPRVPRARRWRQDVRER
jgi:hypothetical protein